MSYNLLIVNRTQEGGQMLFLCPHRILSNNISVSLCTHSGHCDTPSAETRRPGTRSEEWSLNGSALSIAPPLWLCDLVSCVEEWWSHFISITLGQPPPPHQISLIITILMSLVQFDSGEYSNECNGHIDTWLLSLRQIFEVYIHKQI